MVYTPLLFPAFLTAHLHSCLLQALLTAACAFPSAQLPQQVAETTRDVVFLHNEMFFAAAQKKYVYIYDKRGIEIHCLKTHTQTLALQFLPHHFLLVSVGEAGGWERGVAGSW